MADAVTAEAETPLHVTAPLHVMVVEDQPDVREMLRLRLELDGFSVTTAANGKEAIDLARTLHPSLVILDLEMPIMDGRQALPQLRAIDERTRIVIHSGRDVDGLTGTLRPDASVPKGAPLSVLLETIRQLSSTSGDDVCRLTLPPIPLPQAVHAFDSWVGLNARIRESETPEEDAELRGLESLTKIFFELGLQLLSATQRHRSDVVLQSALNRITAERALSALETIRTRGFDAFYGAWGYQPAPEGAIALHQLSDLLTSALIEVTTSQV